MTEENPNILPNGAKIVFTDKRDPLVSDRVELLPTGFVKAIYKDRQEVIVYPPDVIRGIYTRTYHLDLEDEDWW